MSQRADINHAGHVLDPKDKIKFWRVPQLRGSELLRASFCRQSFSRHFHDCYAVGVIEAGALGFHYLGQKVVAGPGDINLAVPGEAHDGFPAGPHGWRYRMFYLSPELIEQVASEAAGRDMRLPFINKGVIKDPALAGEIRSLHLSLESSEDSFLEQQSRLVAILSVFLMRYAEDRPGFSRVAHASAVAERVKEYIRANYADNLSLDKLSQVAGLSRFHLLRVFKRQFGLPPHTYLTQVRVQQAKGLLARGLPIAQAALSVGFNDQSHLNRQFKRFLGTPPGAYRNNIQYKPASLV